MDDDDFMLDGDDDGFGEDEDFCDIDEMEGDDGKAEELEKTPENLYYQAKSTEESSKEQAAKELREVMELEKKERSEYGFKALKKLVKMQLSNRIDSTPEKIVEDFRAMLGYADLVSVNGLEKGVNTVLGVASQEKKFEVLQELADYASEVFLRRGNERAWFRINLNAIEKMLDANDAKAHVDKLAKLVEWCELAPGINNPKKETLLLEVLALQMRCALSDAISGPNGLRRLVLRANKIQSEISQPRALGTIHECSGKVMLYEHNWSNAKQEFFAAFKKYDESGSSRRVICLRYLVLAALLENTKISPFESPETKSFVSDPEIIPVVELWDAFESFNVEKFNKTATAAFENDTFASSFLPILKRCFQYLKITEIVKAYSKVKISYVAKQLMIDEAECEGLLAEFILDGRIDGSLDQNLKVLCMNDENASQADVKYNAMTQWSTHVEQVTNAVSRKIVKFE